MDKLISGINLKAQDKLIFRINPNALDKFVLDKLNRSG
jgi:hypothetical protein